MRAASILSMATLAAAIPNIFERAAKCNSDNCLRAVNGKAPVLSACSSFLSTTVVPCTSTATSTTYTTQTAPTVTSTFLITATASTVTSTTTTTPTTTTTSTTLIQSSTETDTSTATTTVRAQPKSGTKKRGVLKAAAVGNKLDARAPVAACSPTVTIIPSSFPSAAKSCSVASRFSSACICAGVTGTIVTAATPLATTTTTLTITNTPTTVVTSTTTVSTSTSTFVDVSTTTVVITQPTTTVTSTTTTTTSTQTSTTTCNTFIAQATGGAYSGNFLKNDVSATNGFVVSPLGTDQAAAAKYQIDFTSGLVSPVGTPNIVIGKDAIGSDFLRLQSATSGGVLLQCTLAGPPALSGSGSGTALTCVGTNGGASALFTCGNDNRGDIILQASVPASCQAVTLGVYDACDPVGTTTTNTNQGSG